MKTCKFIFTIIIILFSNLFSSTVFSANLIEAYQSALINDPIYKAATAKWMADRENLSIARSALLPQIGVGVTASRSRNESESLPSKSKYFSNNSGYSLQIRQPIFNFGNLYQVRGAHALVKQAQATFLAANEDLLQRVSKAYFETLIAKDMLYFTKANKEALEHLLKQTKHKFDAGLVAVTDLEETRANYDQASAEEIAAVNDLSNAFERLNEITGVKYSSVESVRDNFPLVSPQPNNIEQWVKTAEKQNFSLLASRFNSAVARENVKFAQSGHLPTLTATGDYKYKYEYGNVSGRDDYNRNKTATAGLQLEVPVFQGGKVMAMARQAGHNYQKAISEQDKEHRSIVSSTRQTYLGILSNISKIKADKQAIQSAKSSLRATKSSYSAGMRTMTDVLAAQAQLYKVQKDFAKDEYTYIIQLLTLKQLIGALSVEDIHQINSWLIGTGKNLKKKGEKVKSPAVPRIVVLETSGVEQANKIVR